MKKQPHNGEDRLLDIGLDEVLDGERPRDQIEATLARKRRGDLGAGEPAGKVFNLRRAFGIGLAAACLIVGMGMMVVARPETGLSSRGDDTHAASGTSTGDATASKFSILGQDPLVAEQRLQIAVAVQRQDGDAVAA